MPLGPKQGTCATCIELGRAKPPFPQGLREPLKDAKMRCVPQVLRMALRGGEYFGAGGFADL